MRRYLYFGVGGARGFDRLTGGTAYTVRYAMKQGVPVFNTGSWDVLQLALKRE
ncbi:MAG: hypothetical protein ABTA22_06785 [Clostridia bacterium]